MQRDFGPAAVRNAWRVQEIRFLRATCVYPEAIQSHVSVSKLGWSSTTRGCSALDLLRMQTAEERSRGASHEYVTWADWTVPSEGFFSWPSTCCASSLEELSLLMWELLQTRCNTAWPRSQGVVDRFCKYRMIQWHRVWRRSSVVPRCLRAAAESPLGRHGECGWEGERSSQVRQEVRAHLHRLVLAGQADHPAHAAVAGGWDPQEEREKRLRLPGAAEGRPAGPQPPFRPLCPLQQPQLVRLYIRAQSAAHLALRPQQQRPHVFRLSPAGTAWQPRVRDVLSRLQGLQPRPGRPVRLSWHGS